MKFSEQWLRSWVNPSLDAAEVAEQLTMLGLEVDSIDAAASFPHTIVVGEILEAAPHPNADKLRVCRVSGGDDETLNIVCGAPNAREGIKVPLALVGTSMPNGMQIKAAKLRGEPSHGMLCSARELGLSEDAQGLMELADDAPVGTSLIEYLGLEDHIIDIDLTPNRGDCNAIRGIAHDLAAATATPVTAIECAPVAVSVDDQVPVEIAPGCGCARYAARVVKGIDPSASTPLWMTERLRRSGIRAIHPVVDVTNYVMLELGQPMHGFDLATIQGGIRVRNATAGEVLTLLDGRDMTLDAQTLLICDHAAPIAMAGIMGGEHSGVGDATVDILLESALFVPDAIIGRLRQYNTHTDSGYRYERGVDAELQVPALERATALLQAIAGGQAGPVVVAEQAGMARVAPTIALSQEQLARRLGCTVPAERVAQIFSSLGCDCQSSESGWNVTAPSWRYDLNIPDDLVEEIARVYGYTALPKHYAMPSPAMAAAPEEQVSMARLRETLVARGYQEAVTYSFVDASLQHDLSGGAEAVELANPISSDLAVMRTSLWPGLLRAVQHNTARQQPDARFFESGLRFVLQSNDIQQEPVIAGASTGRFDGEGWWAQRDVDIFDAKADLMALTALATDATWHYVAAEHPALHPGRSARIVCDGEAVGWVGELHPQWQAKLGIAATQLFELALAPLRRRQRAAATPVSRYPATRRDLAVVVDEQVSASALLTTVRESASAAPLVDARLFDLYQGEGIPAGKKSVALGLSFQSLEGTLGDEEIDRVAEQVLTALTDAHGAQLR